MNMTICLASGRPSSTSLFTRAARGAVGNVKRQCGREDTASCGALSGGIAAGAR